LKHYDDLVWQFNNICGGVDCVAILVDDFRATTKEARLAVEQSGDEDAKKFLNDVVCTFKKYVREIVSDAACEVGYSRRATTNLKKIAESSRKIKNARNRNILLYTIIGAIENNTDFDDTKGYTIPLYDKKEMSGVASAINMALL
jgi:hypothetical protein